MSNGWVRHVGNLNCHPFRLAIFKRNSCSSQEAEAATERLREAGSGPSGPRHYPVATESQHLAASSYIRRMEVCHGRVAGHLCGRSFQRVVSVVDPRVSGAVCPGGRPRNSSV